MRFLYVFCCWDWVSTWSVFIRGLRWNESYKKDLFSSRIDTTKSLAQAIAASPNPPHSWVVVSGVGEFLPHNKTVYLNICQWQLFIFIMSPFDP